MPPPAASRRLRKTDRLLVELESYSSEGPPELTVELLNQKGDSLVTLPVAGRRVVSRGWRSRCSCWRRPPTS